MKIELDRENRSFVVKEVYQGFLMETAEGNQIAICMRDDTFEINILPKGSEDPNWIRINMQTGMVEADGFLSPSEAVYGFAGYLTSYGGTLKLGSKHEAGPAVKMVKLFCKVNNLPDPGERWHNLLKMPEAE